MIVSVPFRATPACFCFAFITIFSIASVDAATMTLRWDANPEPIVTGYIVSWGTSSGQYNRVIDVGKQTSFQFEAPTSPTIYFFVVRAYDGAGNQSAPSVEVNTGPWPAPLTLSSIVARTTAPQRIGTTITFRAVATGGIAPYQSKWLIFDGRRWDAVTEWSASTTFAWSPSRPNTSYRVGVWVRSAPSTLDEPDNPGAGGSIPFAITATKISPTITSSRVAPQVTRTSIKFTANVKSRGKYRYKWWVFDGVSWRIKKEWALSRTFTWTPTAPNARYRILVRVQNVAEPRDTAGISIPFPIVSKPSRRRR